MLTCYIRLTNRLPPSSSAIRSCCATNSRQSKPLGSGASFRSSASSLSGIHLPQSQHHFRNGSNSSSTNHFHSIGDSEPAYQRSNQSSFYRLLSGAAAAVAVINGDSNSTKTQKKTSGEADLALPADPWLLTGKKAPTETEQSSNFFTDLFRFLWNLFKFITGSSLAIALYRACKTFLYELNEFRLQHIVNKLLMNSTKHSELGSRVDPYLLASQLCKLISEYAGTGSSYVGFVEALDELTITSLPSSSLSSLVPTRYRPLDHANWTHPYISTETYEELLLSPQYLSFLAESKRDGSVYHIDGYVSVSDSLLPVPLILFYNKVSSSLAELERGNVLDKWQKRLASGAKVGSSVDAERDMSTNMRAMYLSSDLSRFLADEDWERYIGTSRKAAKLVRDRPNGTASSDVWRFQGPAGELVATIDSNPRAPTSSIDITFPETSTSLETNVTLSAVSVFCARLCSYADKHPALNSQLGDNVKVVSAPTIVDSVSEGADFSGPVTEIWCTLAGSKDSLKLHVKIGKDSHQNGTLPIAPVLAVWVNDEQVGQIDIYKNPRERYQHMIETRKSIPVVAQDKPEPLLNQISVASRG